MKKLKSKMNEKSLLKKVLTGLGVSVAVGLASVALMTNLTLQDKVGNMMTNDMMPIVHFLSVLAGSLLIAVGKQRPGILLPLLICGAYMLLLICGNILFFDSGVAVSVGDVLGVACAIGTASIISVLRRGSGRKRVVRR